MPSYNVAPDGIQGWIYGENDKEAVLVLEQANVIYYPVSKALGNVRNNDETLIRLLD